MDKSQINTAVKKIKELRKSDQPAEKNISGIDIKLGSKPEKIMICTGIAAGAAILFNDSHKRKKHPEKARGYIKRFCDDYKKVDWLLDSTIAKELKDSKKHEFDDSFLNNLEIEKAIDFDID